MVLYYSFNFRLLGISLDDQSQRDQERKERERRKRLLMMVVPQLLFGLNLTRAFRML